MNKMTARVGQPNAVHRWSLMIHRSPTGNKWTTDVASAAFALTTGGALVGENFDPTGCQPVVHR